MNEQGDCGAREELVASLPFTEPKGSLKWSYDPWPTQ
jgi:hypothetical protein